MNRATLSPYPAACAMRRAGASGSSVAMLPVSDGRGVSVKRTSFQPDLAPASGSRGAAPSSGCRGMKAACALSRARKLWSWVPGRDSLRRVVEGCDNPPSGSKGDSPWWGPGAKPRSMGRREREGSPHGCMGCETPALEGCNGRAKRHPCQARTLGCGDGRSVRPWLAQSPKPQFRIARNVRGCGVASHAAGENPGRMRAVPFVAPQLLRRRIAQGMRCRS